MTKKLDVRNDFGVSLFSVDDSGKVLFESLGERVGINTINPQHTLDVDGSFGTDQLILKTATAGRVMISASNGSVIDSSALTFDGTTLTANTFAGAVTSSDATITGGTIDGTDIGGTTAAAGSFTTVSASTSVTTPLLTRAGTITISATGANIITASTDGAERVRVDATGNVGIGTTAPVSKLSANGSITAATGAPSTPAFSFIEDTTTGTYLTSDSSYAISVAGSKVSEFGAALQGDNLLEISDENDTVIFSVASQETSNTIFEVFDANSQPILELSDSLATFYTDVIVNGVFTANSMIVSGNTDIGGTLTFDSGAILNVVSDVTAGESANTAAPITNIIQISENDYLALATPDSNTLYVIVD